MLGNRIRLARKRKHLTQKELGLRIGLDNHTISAIENGTKKAERATLRLLADGLGLDPDFFLRDPEKKPPQFIDIAIPLPDNHGFTMEEIEKLEAALTAIGEVTIGILNKKRPPE